MTEHTNTQRADNAAGALDHYAQRTWNAALPTMDGDEREYVLSDLLTDLNHLADRYGLDWDTLLDRAHMHHHEEVTEEARA